MSAGLRSVVVGVVMFLTGATFGAVGSPYLTRPTRVQPDPELNRLNNALVAFDKRLSSVVTACTQRRSEAQGNRAPLVPATQAASLTTPALNSESGAEHVEAPTAEQIEAGDALSKRVRSALGSGRWTEHDKAEFERLALLVEPSLRRDLKLELVQAINSQRLKVAFDGPFF